MRAFLVNTFIAKLQLSIRYILKDSSTFKFYNTNNSENNIMNNCIIADID